MSSSADSPMTPQRWIANLLEAAAEIANTAKQEERWLAPDAMALERPEELICDLFDSIIFEGFIEAFRSIFNEQQQIAADQLSSEMNSYNEKTPTWLDPAEVLADPRWRSIRARASDFAVAFQDWPSPAFSS